MQLFKVWFSLLAVAVCVFAAQPPTELQIETTYMPDECPEKAAKGDTISVHYVSLLFRCCSHRGLMVHFRLAHCLKVEPNLTRGMFFCDTGTGSSHMGAIVLTEGSPCPSNVRLPRFALLCPQLQY